MFKPFYRGASSTSRAVSGSGLGLALVAEHVKAHKGSVELTCPGGWGTMVVVVLPKEQPAN